MKISEAVEDYVLEIEIRKYAERTVATYRDKIKCFGRFCEDEMGIHDLGEVTPSHVKRYTQHMLKRGCKGSYVNSCLKSMIIGTGMPLSSILDLSTNFPQYIVENKCSIYSIVSYLNFK